MAKKINILIVAIFLTQFESFAQRVQEFQTDENFVKNGIMETYKFFDSTFFFSVNLSGFSSARTESMGIYHKINDSTYILNTGLQPINNVNKEKNGVASLNVISPKCTYDVSIKKANNVGKTIFVFSQNAGSFISKRSFVIYFQGLRYKIDMIQDSLTFNSDKVDSFYIIDNNYGIASEEYFGKGKNLDYFIKCNTTTSVKLTVI